LILEAGDEAVEGVDVRVSDLTNGEARIRGSHPLPKPNEYIGVGVELFTEHYLHVETPSYNDPKRGGFNWSAEANPKLTGWIPDALIPFSAKPGRGGAPFSVPANQAGEDHSAFPGGAGLRVARREPLSLHGLLQRFEYRRAPRGGR